MPTVNVDKLSHFYKAIHDCSIGSYEMGLVNAKIKWLKKTIPMNDGIGLMPHEKRDFEYVAAKCKITLDIFNED